MPIIRSIILAACMLLAVEARAQDASERPNDIPDVIYRGLVGKALDALPMEPEKRVVLQRTNAVVSASRDYCIGDPLSESALVAIRSPIEADAEVAH